MEAQRFFEQLSLSVREGENHRCRYIPFDKHQNPANGKNGSSPLKQTLNGEWAFSLFNGLREIPDEMLKENYDITSMEKTALVRLFDIEEGGGFPFAFSPVEIPDINPTAVLIKDVNIKEMRFPKKYLVFEGIAGAFSVFINGKAAVCGSGDQSLCEFDISRFLKEGKNRFVFILTACSSQSFLDAKELFGKFGLFRPVYLLSRPQGHVRDIAYTAKLSDDFREGEISVEIESDAAETAIAVLFDNEGNEVSKGRFNEDGRTVLTVFDPALWNIETPDLYTLEIVCCGEFIYKNIGFRRFYFVDGQARLNGRSITLNGCIYNDNFLSISDMKNDVLLMKRNHINAVLVSGVCADDGLLSLCDRFGILVVCGMNLDSTAFDRANDERYASDYSLFPLISSRIESQTHFLRGHTSLIGWCFDRFCKEGRNIFEAIELVRKFDTSSIFYAGSPSDTARTTKFEQRPDVYCIPDNDRSVLSDPLSGGKMCVILGGIGAVDERCIMGRFSLDFRNKLPLLKEAALPFKIDEIDAAGGDFYVTNMFKYSYLSRLECLYEVTSRGEVTEKGFVGVFPLPPEKCDKFHVDFTLPEGDENYIRFVFKRFGSCAFANDGFDEGSVQFRLPDNLSNNLSPDSGEQQLPDIKVSENDCEIKITGSNFVYVFSKLYGGFSQIKFENRILLSSPAIFEAKSNEKTFCPAFINTEYSDDCGTAVIHCNQRYMPKGDSAELDIVSVWCVNKSGKITLDSAVSNVESLKEIDALKLNIPFENNEFKYFGFGQNSRYNGIFRTESEENFAMRKVRSAVIKNEKKQLCLFTSDRIDIEVNKNEVKVLFPKSFENGRAELSISICPTRSETLIYE